MPESEVPPADQAAPEGIEKGSIERSDSSESISPEDENTSSKEILDINDVLSRSGISGPKSYAKELTNIQVVGLKLGKMVFFLISAIVIVLLVDIYIMRPIPIPEMPLPKGNMDEQKQILANNKEFLEHYKILIDAAQSRSVNIIDNIIKTMLTVFGTIVGYVLGHQNSKDN